MTTSSDPWAVLQQLLETLPVDVRLQADLLRAFRACQAAVADAHGFLQTESTRLRTESLQFQRELGARAMDLPPEPPRLQLAEAHDTRRTTIAKKAKEMASAAKKKLHRP